MGQLQVLLSVVLVICYSLNVKTAFVPGLMDLLNMDVTTEPTVRTFPPTKPGQVNSARCAYTKNGCCKDGRTPSPGPNGEGCARELCYDEHPGDCYMRKLTGVLDCSVDGIDRINCPYRCGDCKPAASPLSRCMQLRPALGCCWDGTIPVNSNGRGCRVCEDMIPHVCQQFAQVSGGCDSGSLGIRGFMNNQCPKTCGHCYEGL